MEVEQNTPVIAKKLWANVRVVFYMLKKGLSKKKLLWLDLHMLFKRSKLAGKALSNLMLEHQSALTCRSNDIHMSFISPREYEFSCSNSPVYPSYHHHNRRQHHNGRRHRVFDDQYEASVVVQTVYDILNNHYETSVEASPLSFPNVRQLRVTDSPFPLKDGDEDTQQVNKAADEFIKNFYEELKEQKKRAALESPSPYHKWGQYR